MFEKFVNDIKNMPVTPPILLDMDISNDPRYSIDAFKRKILHNAEIPDDELYTFIKSQYRSILRSIFDMRDQTYLQFFMNHKFILTLTSVMGQIDIDEETRMYCNKIIYDYITYDGHQQDIAELMIALSKVVNRDNIMQLKGIGLDEERATYIAMAARSSDTDTINIRRTNFIIATNCSDMWENLDDEEDMLKAEQIIVYIYQKLFTRLVILFEATMFDIYDASLPWMTEKIEIMYSLTSSAILHILDQMPLMDIKTVLKNYSFDYSVLSQNGKRPRFSLNSLSGDFNRINYAIELLRHENVFVP